MFEQKGYNAHQSPSGQRNCNFNWLRKLSSASVRALAVTVLFGSTWTFAQTLTTIYNMGANPNDGADPERGIIFDKAGNIYGMDSIGGSSRNEGTIFKLVRPSQSGGQWEETILHQFTGAPDGNTPESTLVLTSTGKLVGTTSRGGDHDMGTAFIAFPKESDDDPWGGKIVYSFGSFFGDAINPNTGLLFAQGKFFGATIGGGTKNRGTVSSPRAMRHFLPANSSWTRAAISTELQRKAAGTIWEQFTSCHLRLRQEETGPKP
jgi:hypothetical protein